MDVKVARTNQNGAVEEKVCFVDLFLLDIATGIAATGVNVNKIKPGCHSIKVYDH